MYSKIVISACQRVSRGRRQISSALIIMKKVSTAALSKKQITQDQTFAAARHFG